MPRRDIRYTQHDRLAGAARTSLGVLFVMTGAVGALLLAGAYARVAAALVIVIMAAATYVHLVVDNPALFPLQPHAPIIPLAGIAMSSLRAVGGSRRAESGSRRIRGGM